MPDLDDTRTDTSSLELACHCGKNTYSFPVTLPLDRKRFAEIQICQCSDCRLQTGNLAGWFVHAPSEPFHPDNPPDTLVAYKTSTTSTRYFCRTCSSQLFYHNPRPRIADDCSVSNYFWIATGCLKIPCDEKFGIGLIDFIDKTADGGLASWLPDCKFHSSSQGELTNREIQALEHLATHPDSTEKLPGRCHCSTVKLRLSRPTGKAEELPPDTWSDNTDLVIPHWTPTGEQPPIDEKNPWWIRGESSAGKGKRFLGGHCTCVSCRTIAGTEVQSWLFVPTTLIELILPNEEIIPWPSREALIHGSDERVKDIIGVYKSTAGSPGVVRGFCKTCGANIFWDGLTRKNLVDLSAGLFTVRGMKERQWIEWWTDRVSYIEDSYGRHDIGSLLEKGLRIWKQAGYS